MHFARSLAELNQLQVFFFTQHLDRCVQLVNVVSLSLHADLFGDKQRMNTPDLNVTKISSACK